MTSGRDYSLPIAAMAALCALSLLRPELLRPYFGSAPPVLAAGAVAIAGLCLLRLLVSSGGFPRRTRLRAAATPVLASVAAFAVAIVAADFVLRYPQNLNAPMPWALLFYPAIGYVAEVVFHLAPLALVLTIARTTGGAASRMARPAGMILAALTEPAFQLHAALAGAGPDPLAIYTFIHVLAFSTVQLALFRRYGFAAMFTMRLGYYAVWHVVWGMARLHLLF